MRKRRVLALWLALSLVVSGNGMTVLAAETGMEQPVVTTQTGTDVPGLASQEVLAENAPEEKEAVSDNTDQEPEIEDKSEETEPSAGEDKTEEGELPENPDQVDDEQPSAEEDEAGGQEDTPEAEGQEPTVSENDVEEIEEPETEKPEKSAFQAEAYVSRIVTFTDDTGMQVTYDANRSLQYRYIVENGVLTGVKQIKHKPDESGNDIEVEEPVEFKGNVELGQPEEGEQYTSVAANLFQGNQQITYVKLPVGLTSIAAEGFKGCSKLKGAYLPSTVTEIGAGAFENCTTMTQISVPKGVTSIGDGAFKGDARLYMVYMKDTDYSSLERIGDYAFDGCAALEAFCADTQFFLPTSLKTIGEYAFYGCRKIKKLNLNDASMETMGAHAFGNCIGLTDATMSKTLAVIPQHAFEGCTALVSLTFESKAGQWVTISEHAFGGCYNLTSLVLPGTISEVKDFAFAGCTNLRRVEVKNDNLLIGATRAFPVGETGSVLQFIGRSGSTIYEYCRGKDKVVFIEDANAAVQKYYQYVVKDKDGVEHADGKIPGGRIWIGPVDKSRYEDNINKMKDEQGKEAGVRPSNTQKYRIYYEVNEGYHLVTGSLRANGDVLQADSKKVYYVTMPVGGIILTAEFSQEASEKINGLKEDITVEYSNGEPIDNGVEIKVGQTTRIFLIDKTGEPIDAAKIEDISTNAKAVATVSKNGIVKAAGAGTATITIYLRGGDGNQFPVQSRIRVVEADVDALKLKAMAYDSQFTITGNPDGIQTATIDKNIIRDEALTITLKANAYTANREGVAKEFTWKSSDPKIVKPQKNTTKGDDATNVLEVQKGCMGEATITVTAKNKISGSVADRKETVTQKFVVCVQSLSGRLASSSITVNPNLSNGGLLEVLLSYGMGMDASKTKLYKEESAGTYIESLDFILEKTGESAGKAYQYQVKPSDGTKEGTYKLFVGLNGAIPNKDNLLPLTIIVKKSVPAPTVKFNTGKAKFNLFYTNGGEDKNGNPITVTTEITKLGTAEVEKVELEALSGQEDDRRFLENFEIKRSGKENGKYTVVIGRTANNLRYTNAKQPAVTGNLVIYYVGYEAGAAKKVKVKMPIGTTAPSYALRTAKATYRDGYTANETLELFDKKSKTKEQVVLNPTEDSVDAGESTIMTSGEPQIQADGTIAVRFIAENGNLKLALTNRNWDFDKDGNKRTLNFTYKVNVSNQLPTVKTDPASVILNLNCPEQTVSFRLAPNQKGVALSGEQTFVPVSNAADIENLEVTYTNGEGTVKIKDGKPVSKGTYKFECSSPASPDYSDLKKVILKVEVKDNKPTVKFGKGSLQLNTSVYRDNSLKTDSLSESGNQLYQETASLPFTVSGKPEGYEIAAVGTGDQATEIKTKSGGVADDRFAFSVKEGNPAEKISDTLEVSLKNGSLPAGTYKFTMTQRYLKAGKTTVTAKPVDFSVKVIGNIVELKVSSKGKLNLVNRKGEADEKNGIVYTPTLKNINGEITEVKILEGGENGLEESRRFDARLIEEGKNKGKIFVTPKVTQAPGTNDDEYVELKNNTNYPVRIWVKVKGYAGTSQTMDGVMTKTTVMVKTAQVLPKVTTDKSLLDVYFSTKNYDASFTVKPKEGSVGEIETIYFGEKDDNANDSFELIRTPQADGSMKVTVHLKEAVGFANGTVNNVKFYVKYKGQGTNTPEKATGFTMKIRVN